MEPTNRSPVYSDKNNDYRIVSVPNGKWQFQRRIGKSSREQDAWTPLARPSIYDTAMAQMRVGTPS